MSWFEQVRDRARVPEVALALGFAVKRRALGPCPACGEGQRGSSDARLPVGIVAGKMGDRWKCFRCGQSGDALSLVCWRVEGLARPQDWGRVRAWCVAAQLCEGQEDAVVELPPVELPVVAEEPDRPVPRAEVAALWRSTAPVAGHAGAEAFLQRRAVEAGLRGEVVVGRVAALELARVAVGTAPWAGIWERSKADEARPVWRDWRERWPLVLPCWDANGRLQALRGRAVDAQVKPKEISPIGRGTTTGAVYACDVGRRLLRAGAARPGDAIIPERPWVRWSGLVLVVEGGPDYLIAACSDRRVAWVQTEGGAELHAAAVLGVYPGAWPAEGPGRRLASRLVGASEVIVRTDGDEGGDMLAKHILNACASEGVRATRLRPEEA